MVCDKCNNGHVLVAGIWRKCQCQVRKDFCELAYASGVLPGTKFYVLRDVPGYEKWNLKLNGVSLYIEGKDRMVLAYSIFLWFLASGYFGCVGSLGDLADCFVNKNQSKSEWKQKSEMPVLLVKFGREKTSGLHTDILRHLMDYRSIEGYFTILVDETVHETGDLVKRYAVKSGNNDNRDRGKLTVYNITKTSKYFVMLNTAGVRIDNTKVKTI